MQSNQPDIITENTYDTVWKIRHFDRIILDEGLINNQKFELKTSLTHNTTCTWVIGIRKSTFSAAPAIKMYCRLNEIKGNSEAMIEALFQYEVLKVDGKAHHVSRSKFVYKRGAKKEALFCSFRDINQIFSSTDTTVVVNIKLASLRLVKEDPAIFKKKCRLASNFNDTLRDNMSKLVSDDEFSDIKIVTSDDMELHGHKVILQMQNPVFASMLRSDLSESRSGIIKVNDVSGKTMKIILRYLYTGDLLPSWSDADIIAEFIYAAGKYQLGEILTMLDDTLGRDTSQEYKHCLISILSLASKLSLKRAEVRLLEQFAKQANEVKSADELFVLMGEQGTHFTATE